MKNKEKQFNNTIEEKETNTDLCNNCNKPKAPEGVDKNKGDKYCKCGRNTKLTKEFLEVAEEIIEDDINAIIHTDEDLLFLINEKLRDMGLKDNTITRRTFINWKNKVKETGDMEAGIEEIEDETVQRFFHIIKRALIKQKENLFQEMRDSEEKKSWTRFAWILERKFNDWNLKHQLSVDKEERLIIMVDDDE